jgi:hypothetical protein
MFTLKVAYLENIDALSEILGTKESFAEGGNRVNW